MSREDLVGDSRYSTPEARLERLDEVYALVEEWSSKHTKFEVMEILNEIDVPCGPIMATEDLIKDEHLRSRQMIVDVEHPKRGTFTTVGCPLKLSDSPVEIEASPLLGEHTEEILTGTLNYTAEDVQRMRDAGAV
jgi:formyl-CoA transferase